MENFRRLIQFLPLTLVSVVITYFLFSAVISLLAPQVKRTAQSAVSSVTSQ